MAGDDMVKGVAKNRDRASLVERAAARFSLLDNGEAPSGATIEHIPAANEPSPRHIDRPPAADAPLACLDAAKLERLGARLPDGSRNQTTEEFRVVKRSVLETRTALMDAGAGNASTIMVTSAQTEEGKTFTAVNLALSLSMEPDLTVVLVDADFSRKTISGLFSFGTEKGLIEALSESGTDLSEVYFKTDIPDLFVVPAGRPHPRSAELLGSRRMQELVSERIKATPDCVVIFDAPPVLATSEAGVLAPHVGQVVFVVEAERTTRATAEEAIGLLRGCSQVGVVLNKVRHNLGSSSYGRYQKNYAND